MHLYRNDLYDACCQISICLPKIPWGRKSPKTGFVESQFFEKIGGSTNGRFLTFGSRSFGASAGKGALWKSNNACSRIKATD